MESIKKSYFWKGLIVFVLILSGIFLMNPTKLHSESLWKETLFSLNLNGGLGLAYFDDPEAAIKGGPGANLDILFINLHYLNLGLSGGTLLMTKSLSERDHRSTLLFPIHVLCTKLLQRRGARIYPYLQLSSGIYLKKGFQSLNSEFLPSDQYKFNIGDDADPGTKLKVGGGGQAGMGLLLRLKGVFYLDVGLRYHLVFLKDEIFQQLQCNFGMTWNVNRVRGASKKGKKK